MDSDVEHLRRQVFHVHAWRGETRELLRRTAYCSDAGMLRSNLPEGFSRRRERRQLASQGNQTAIPVFLCRRPGFFHLSSRRCWRFGSQEPFCHIDTA